MPGSTNRRLGERRQSQRRALDFPGPVFFGGSWQTSAELIGYAIEAADGPVGRVADFWLEEESAVITEIVVITRRRLLPLQKRMFVPVNAIERIDWAERKIYLRPTREELRQSSKRRFPWGRS